MKDTEVVFCDNGFRAVSCDLVDRPFIYRHEGHSELTNAAKQIDLYLSATATVLCHTFYQREFVVLDSTADC